jgi:hypothetical protein
MESSYKALATEMASLINTIDALEEQKKENTKTYNEKIRGLASRLRKIQQQIDSGSIQQNLLDDES